MQKRYARWSAPPSSAAAFWLDAAERAHQKKKLLSRPQKPNSSLLLSMKWHILFFTLLCTWLLKKDTLRRKALI